MSVKYFNDYFVIYMSEKKHSETVWEADKALAEQKLRASLK